MILWIAAYIACIFVFYFFMVLIGDFDGEDDVFEMFLSLIWPISCVIVLVSWVFRLLDMAAKKLRRGKGVR